MKSNNSLRSQLTKRKEDKTQGLEVDTEILSNKRNLNFPTQKQK